MRRRTFAIRASVRPHSQRAVADRLQSALGLRTRVKLVEPGTIERTAGAGTRVLDLREQG